MPHLQGMFSQILLLYRLFNLNKIFPVINIIVSYFSLLCFCLIFNCHKTVYPPIYLEYLLITLKLIKAMCLGQICFPAICSYGISTGYCLLSVSLWLVGFHPQPQNIILNLLRKRDIQR